MDKNLHLRKLADIKTRPAVCHSVRELVEILTKVVNEIPDDTFACELRNKAKFWYTSEELNDHSLSLAEALEAALAGKRVQHKT